VVRYDQRKPLQNFDLRVNRHTVPDLADDKRTWSEEQRWDGAKPREVAQTYRNAGVTKRRKMRTYFRRVGDKRKLKLVQDIEREV
jgi:hypothetical protein